MPHDMVMPLEIETPEPVTLADLVVLRSRQPVQHLVVSQDAQCIPLFKASMRCKFDLSCSDDLWSAVSFYLQDPTAAAECTHAVPFLKKLPLRCTGVTFPALAA